MEELELNKTTQNSITLKKDSKGNYNYDIKIYFDEDENKAIERIQNIDKELKTKFGGKNE